MGTQQALPQPPVPPPCRVEYHSMFGPRMFSSQRELDDWKGEPFWRKALGATAYDRRVRG